LLIALILAAVAAPGTWTVDSAHSELRYAVTHKLHKVDATSKEAEGKAVLRPDGTLMVEVRAPVASFKSGDGNRDEHMLEVMNVGAHPFVVFKGVGRLPDGNGPLQLQGQVELHGVKTPAPVSLSLAAQPDGSLRVEGSFDVSLDAHGIERPSLLFAKVDDACRIVVDLLLRGPK
jgi:polyisoprenoid-binding protein YceI